VCRCTRERLDTPSDVVMLAAKATVIAIAISSIIPGRRVRTSSTAPARNGRPPYR
jgi:hypothetical protein